MTKGNLCDSEQVTVCDQCCIAMMKFVMLTYHIALTLTLCIESIHVTLKMLTKMQNPCLPLFHMSLKTCGIFTLFSCAGLKLPPVSLVLNEFSDVTLEASFSGLLSSMPSC